MREHVKKNSSENVVYCDESGFLETIFNPYGWSPRGRKIYGDKDGKRSKRINLIMAQRDKKWLAPVLFEGSCDALLVEEWFKNHLFKELKKSSLIIMDNAPFHRKKKLHEIAENHQHKILFLPSYSPDFNPIEKTFGFMKKRRLYAAKGTTLETIVMDKNYLE